MSGISNDMRELEASSDPRAAFAIDYFVYRVGLYAGMLAAALGGLDAFVFTAGIGENSRKDPLRRSPISWPGWAYHSIRRPMPTMLQTDFSAETAASRSRSCRPTKN